MSFSVAAPSILRTFSDGGRPHWRAIVSNAPPSVSVADVSTVVRLANSRSRSSPPTPSGATRSEGAFWLKSPDTHTTSCSSPNASRIRTAQSWTSSSNASASLRAVAPSGSSLRSGPIADTQLCAASRVAASAPASALGNASSRPDGMSSRIIASPSLASASRSATSWSISRPHLRAAIATDAPLSSSVATDVTRSTRSCASSITTTSWSGRTW